MKLQIKAFLQMAVWFVFLLTLAISILLFWEGFYHLAMDWLYIPDLVSLRPEDLKVNYHQLMTYLTNPSVKVLTMQNFPSSASGLFHFAEVKRLFMINLMALGLTGILSIWSIFTIYKKKTWIFYRMPARFFLVFPMVLMALMSLGFDQFFVAFHKVFFHNDAWLFNPVTDPIVMALPADFFLMCFAFVFLFVLVGMLVTYWIIGRKSSLPKEV